MKSNKINLTKKQLKELARTFKKYNVVFAYLFGSQATGKAGRGSDYDFAVMLPEKYNSDKRFKIRLELMGEAGRIVKCENLDLVILNDINSILFKFVIISEGKVIYENDHLKRLKFELKTMNNYYDFSPFLNAYGKAFMERAMA
jgi:predicted nucleotidyltransferase